MAQKEFRHGQFTWRELLCPDPARARAFYGELLGWSFEDMPMPSGPYTIASLGARQIAGIWKMPPDAPFPPNWGGYVSVASADRAIQTATELGATLLMPAQSVEGVGRFAPLRDPTGAAFSVLEPSAPGDPAPERPAGHDFCWESLSTTDVEKAKAFYGAVVGWKIDAAPSSGMPLFSAGAKQVADIQPAQPGGHSAWLSHVLVEKLEPARDRVVKLGGKVVVPVIDIEKVGRMTIVADPMGAVLSLFEPGPMM